MKIVIKWMFALLAGLALYHTIINSVSTAVALDHPWQPAVQPGQVNIVVIDSDHASDQSVYRTAYEALCSSRKLCEVMYWIEGTDYPRSMPMTDSQLAAWTAKIAHNKSTGWSQELWDCSRFDAETDCLSK